MSLQIEVAEKLLNNNDATIQGILLAFIVILLVFLGILWKEIKELNAYIKTQDKANLEMLSELTKYSENLGKDVSHIRDYTNETKPKVDGILSIIEKRLNT
tara:strand:+ start:29183 stop:29485 length:303 start_codon:yes stop_codon:yes gene_type:complete